MTCFTCHITISMGIDREYGSLVWDTKGEARGAQQKDTFPVFPSKSDMNMFPD